MVENEGENEGNTTNNENVAEEVVPIEKTNPDEEIDDIVQNHAATKIQALFRRYRIRKPYYIYLQQIRCNNNLNKTKELHPVRCNSFDVKK